ncbi:MAG: hypothetical protein HUU38_24965 [Anaerolineales bacterium]|nr:hypothetical protein [Anaerolineales bacterium]
MNDPHPLLAQIEQQQHLSEQAGQAILKALKPIYYPDTPTHHIHYGEIGSYGRGTNTDPVPDLDIMFLNIPTGPRGQYTDWTPTDTYSLVANHTGITEIAKLWGMDPKLVEAIGATRKALAETFRGEGDTKFNWVRSWSVFPGLVFNISAPVPGYGWLDFDINLYHPPAYFGVEHGKRFNQYFARVRRELGESRAAQLILDIRHLKERVKEGARIPITKSLDRSKKVTGIIPECLFTSLFPPFSYTEIRQHLNRIPTSTLPYPDPNCDYTQNVQIVDSGMTPLEVIHSFRQHGVLTDGGWKNLRAALQ